MHAEQQQAVYNTADLSSEALLRCLAVLISCTIKLGGFVCPPADVALQFETNPRQGLLSHANRRVIKLPDKAVHKGKKDPSVFVVGLR